jgi:Raf kinase inhibitor-like YbhB/YbcL family protein
MVKRGDRFPREMICMRLFTSNKFSRPVGVKGSIVLMITIGVILAACSGGGGNAKEAEGSLTPTDRPMQLSTSTIEAAEVQEEQEGTLDERLLFSLTSPAFKEGESVPSEYSCDGLDQSPGLQWSGVPIGTSSLALIMDDPDAPGGIWVHWILFNIPGEVASLPASIPSEAVLADGSTHGANSWGRTDYDGPCPPRGMHRYFFRLYALDSYLTIPEGSPVETVNATMEGHILGEASLMGTYER